MGTLGIAVDQIFEACERNPSFYADLLHSLRPKISDRRIKCDCPNCNDFSGWLKPGDKVIKCDHANKCGRETHVLAALIGDTSEQLTGDAFVQAVKEAARITGVPIEEYHAQQNNFTPRVPVEALERAWQICRAAIRDPAVGNKAVDHLVARGFSEEFALSNFGYLPNVAGLKSELNREELQALGFANETGWLIQSWTDRVIIPARDAHGRIVGLHGRTLCGDKAKYLNTLFEKSKHPFGLQRAKKHKKVIVVESQMCVLLFNYLGFESIVAVAGRSITAETLLLLARYGIEQIVVFLDTDAAGTQGTMSLLNAFDTEPGAPELFIGELPYGKAPDDYVATFGIESFIEIARRPVHAHRFRAQFWFKQLERDGLGILIDGQLARYIEQCAQYLDTITSQRIKIRALDMFLAEVCKLSGVERHEIQAIRREFASAQANKDNAQRLITALGAAYGKAREGSAAEAKAMIRTALDSGLVDYNKRRISTIEVWDELQTYFNKIAARDLIGIKTGFRPFDECLSGARGLMLLAGGSNVGKTTFMLQLATDAVLLNDDVCVLVLSFEMLRRELNGRILARLAETDWRQLRFMFKEEYTQSQAYWQQYLCDRVFSRMHIINPVRDDWFYFSPDAVIEEMNWIMEKSGCKRCAIVVDYVDIVPGYEEKCGANENLRQQYIYTDFISIKHRMPEDNPIMAISAVRKEGQSGSRESMNLNEVMGSAIRVYASDIVAVWNVFSDQYLYETCDLTHDFHAIIPLNEPIESDWQKIRNEPPTRFALRRARNHLREVGRGLSRLELAKVRDGMDKCDVNMTVNYRQNYVLEGIQPG